jgi:cell division protein FtsL
MAQVLRSAEKKSVKFSHAAVMLLILAIVCMGILSMMRSDSQAFDLKISRIQEQIAACEKEYNDLKREAVGMMSPSSVYVYAVRQLGMAQVHLAGAIRVDGVGHSDGTTTAQLVNAGMNYSN